MSPSLLRIFNEYVGANYTLAQAAEYVASVPVLPIPERVSLVDWRVHVPMPLLQEWQKLSDEERIVVFVMAQSSTHPHECTVGPEEPAMN